MFNNIRKALKIFALFTDAEHNQNPKLSHVTSLMISAAQNELIHNCKTLQAQQHTARYVVPSKHYHLGPVI